MAADVAVAAAFLTALMLIAGAVLWLRRRYVAVDIVGASMEPAYRSGGRVLVRRTRRVKVRRGDVVVFDRDYGDAATPQNRPRAALRPARHAVHQDRSWMLKRAVAVPGDPVPRDRVPALRETAGAAVPAGHLVVLGDNPAASLDSRHFGYVTPECLLGVVVRNLPTR